MGILLIAAYFGIGGLRVLWSHFSSYGMPSSFGEVFTSTILIALLEIAIAGFLLARKNWARQAALGSTLYTLGKVLILIIQSPALIAVSLVYLAPFITFLTGLGTAQMVVLIVVGILATFGISLIILFLLMRKSCVATFLGADTLDGTTFVERFLISRDYLMFAWILVYVVLNNFQTYMPRSFYNAKDQKDFKVLVKDIQESPGYKEMKLKEEQQREEALFLNLEFSADQKSLYVQLNKERRHEVPEFYVYDLTTYKLTPVLMDKQFDLKNISPDKKYLISENHDKLYDLSSQKVISLRESIGVILSDPLRGYTSFGFGPKPYSYLKYYNEKESIILYDLLDQHEIQKYPLPLESLTQLNYYPFSLLTQGIVFDAKSKTSWHWKVDKTEVVQIANLPTLLDMVVLADEDEQGFVAVKRNFYDKEKSSFVLRFSDPMIANVTADGEPIAVSFKNNYLVYKQAGKLKKIALNGSQPETELESHWVNEVVWSRGQNVLYYRDRNSQLRSKDILSGKDTVVAPMTFVRRGDIDVSRQGHLIAAGAGRTVYIFWKSEIGKEKPRFVQFEIKKKESPTPQ